MGVGILARTTFGGLWEQYCGQGANLDSDLQIKVRYSIGGLDGYWLDRQTILCLGGYSIPLIPQRETIALPFGS